MPENRYNNDPNIKPHWLNKTDMAASIGITPRQFTNWDITPVYKKGNMVFYDVNSVLANRLAHAKGDFVEGDGLDGSTITKSKSDLLLNEAKRKTIDLKNAQTERKLIPVGILEHICAGISMNIGAILDAAPALLQRKFPDLHDDIIAELDETYRSCMNRIGNMDEEIEEFLDGLKTDD